MGTATMFPIKTPALTSQVGVWSDVINTENSSVFLSDYSVRLFLLLISRALTPSP